jgi:hypothetical protein
MSPACALAQADATGTAIDVAAGCDDVDPVDCAVAVAVGTTTGGAATLDGTAPAEGTAPAVDVGLGAEAGDVVAVVLGEAVGAAE